jgi:hypothetical protein
MLAPRRTPTSTPVASTIAFLSLLTLCSLPASSFAQDADIGSAQTVEGTVSLLRAGAASPLAIGGGVRMKDEVQVAPEGRAKILFADETVLLVTGGSSMVIDEMVYQPDTDDYSTGFGLLRGKVRSFISDEYSGASASLQVSTRTATAGVRGTDFIVTYDERTGKTEILAIAGKVAVTGLASGGPEVSILPGEVTSVARGGSPAAARPVGIDELNGYLRDLDFPGASLGLVEGILAGAEATAESDNLPGPDNLIDRNARAPRERRQLGDILEGSPAIGAGGFGIEF